MQDRFQARVFGGFCTFSKPTDVSGFLKNQHDAAIGFTIQVFLRVFNTQKTQRKAGFSQFFKNARFRPFF